jgi:hypothetical protein
VLLTLMGLGAIVSLIGGTSLFAALTDTARSGTNDVSSAALAASADIQLATATYKGPPDNTIACGTFSEDLTTPWFEVSDVGPGYFSDNMFFCIKNIGSQSVTLSVVADPFTDTDFACTGDEASNGDATCGADEAGELSDVLVGQMTQMECPVNNSATILGRYTFRRASTTPLSLGSLDEGATQCYYTSVEYPPGWPAQAEQTAQSDRVVWRYRFDAQA